MWLREKKWLRWAWLVLLLVLAACGGAEDSANEAAMDGNNAAAEEEVNENEAMDDAAADEEAMDDEALEEEAADEEAEFEQDDSGQSGGAGPGTEADGTEPDDQDRPDEPGPGTGPKGVGEEPDDPNNNGNNNGNETEVADLPREGGASATAEATPNASNDPIAVSDPLPEASRLSAGEVDDNVDWDAYLAYLDAYDADNVLRVPVSDRYVLNVSDATGAPVLGATVTLLADDVAIATLQTHADGTVYLFPEALGTPAGSTLTTLINVDGESVTVALPTTPPAEPIAIAHPAVQPDAPLNLDILFVIDTTGSMQDQINALRDNIDFIATSVSDDPTAPNVRYGMVAYRDRGEQYVARLYDFTTDVVSFSAELDGLFAAGGGDYPEDLNAALDSALNQASWRSDEVIRLIFVVSDAPPQLEYADQTYTYVNAMQDAAAEGIKIFPIGASNLDLQGEYVFRQLAQYTGGRFIFLTDESGGTGGEDASSATVESYDVDSLELIVLAIIQAELAAADG